MILHKRDTNDMIFRAMLQQSASRKFKGQHLRLREYRSTEAGVIAGVCEGENAPDSSSFLAFLEMSFFSALFSIYCMYCCPLFHPRNK